MTNFIFNTKVKASYNLNTISGEQSMSSNYEINLLIKHVLDSNETIITVNF